MGIPARAGIMRHRPPVSPLVAIQALRQLVCLNAPKFLYAGVGALGMPFIIVPIRRSLGLPTYQWDANPDDHPVRGFQTN